ncbi:hypothetical protein [Ramlibacter sp. 2FC]|uniref:FFLEELY motif protein n=1 Tax=Ramlibacter sp. 2FC TaxID=2502188 RepID=UPI0010F83226|nr:hypothetical protein [Ramlibacter sp. 2FC]
MDAAQRIRDAVASVAKLRQQSAAEPRLALAVQAIKRLQAQRFAGSYADLLAGGSFQAVARFFLDELYGDRDDSERDAQFARIAGALESLFPEAVATTAAALAELHALTEQLDHAMGRAWLDGPHSLSRTRRYVEAWQAVGQPALRKQQLDTALVVGEDLVRLARMPGLGLMLKMMRKPAHAAGLGAIQALLEHGFETFSALARRREGVAAFLALLREREEALLELLFEGQAVACETQLDRLLGQAR